jgi:hypothetical protein
LGNLFSKVFLPSLPDRVYSMFDKEWLAPMWTGCATPEFAAYIRQHPRLPREAFREQVGLHANQIDLLENGYLTQRIEAWANNGAQNQLVYTYPLLDKRLIEFSLGIPAELYIKDGYARYLFRYAVAGILPEEVRWGSAKYEPRRVARYLDTSCDAAKVWLAQAKEKGWLFQPNPYIDPQSLVNLSPQGNSDIEKITYKTTLIKSIQVLVASKT